MTPILTRLPLRQISWLAFFAAILFAWWAMYAMSTGMGLDLIGRPGPAAQAMRGMDPGMDMDMPMARFGPLFGMWALMMAAMMLPTMVPTLQSYDALIRSANGSRAGWLGVLAGYFAVWLVFAAAISGLHLVLLQGGVIDMLGIATSLWVSAALLILVGAFQFSRTKAVCHGVCHSPMAYFLSRWRPGGRGGLRMGLGLGVYCTGCCWGFMVLGFTGGVMSLLWMGLATLFMILEKLPDIGHRLTRPAGVALIAAGLLVAGRAAVTG